MDRRTAVLTTLRVAAVCGLASGFLESLVRSQLPWAPPYRIHLGGYLWWMPAASNFVWFMVLGAGAALLAAWQPRWITTGRLFMAFGWLGFLDSLVLVSPPLHRVAAMVLAAGLAVGLARVLEGRPGFQDRVVRSGWVALLAVVVVVAGAVELSRARRESHALDAPRPPAGSPNVLLLVLDNVGGRHLSGNGYFRRTTPVLDSLAAHGTSFQRAFATSSWSLPSHASLMTGRWAHELEASWRTPLAAEHLTLAEVFADRGYATAGFVANGAYAQRETGLGQGFARYEDYPLSLPQILMSSRLGLMMSNIVQTWIRPLPGPPSDIWHRRSAADLHERLVRWTEKLEQRPFLAFLNYFDAHVPYYAPADLPPFPDPPPAAAGVVSADGLPFPGAASSEHYDRAIRGMDREIGGLVASLDERGLLDNTIIVVTADHGEEFEEHGIFGHGNTLYEAGLRIPLILIYDGRVPAGLKPRAPVSLRDVAATIADLARLGGQSLPGCTLARYWAPDAEAVADTLFASLRRGVNTDPAYPVSRGDMVSVMAGPWHYIRNGDGVEELYNLGTDPWEQRNLAADSVGAGIMTTLGQLPGQQLTERPCSVGRSSQ